MALTLSSSFVTAFESGTVRPILTVSIQTATGDTLADFCTGDEVLSFSGVYNPFTGSVTGAKTLFPVVSSVSVISSGLDPVKRSTTRSDVEFVLLQDGFTETLVSGTKLRGKSVNIFLGTSDMTTHSDWAPVFRGVITEVLPVEGSFQFKCIDHINLLKFKPFYGRWFNEHPLTAAHMLLLEGQAPSAQINDSSFFPGTYTDIGHFNMSLRRSLDNPAAQFPGQFNGGALYGYSQHEVTEGDSLDVLDTLGQIAQMCYGAIFQDESGQIKFVKYDSAASVNATWTVDDIDGLAMTSQYTGMVNQVDIKHGPGVTLGEAKIEYTMTAKDAASQSAYAYPGESKHIRAVALNWPILDHQPALSDLFPATSTGAILQVFTSHGMAGTRDILNKVKTCTITSGDATITTTADTHIDVGQFVTGTGIPTNAYVASVNVRGQVTSFELSHNATDNGAQSLTFTQGRYAGLSADRLAYFKVGSEVVKCNAASADQNTHYVETVFNGLEDPFDANYTDETTFTITHRGQLGTDDVPHNPSDQAQTGGVVDVTMAKHYSDIVLHRFSNGCRMVKVTTSLKQWNIQIGDTVVLDLSDQSKSYPVTYGTSGYEDEEWEVISKEADFVGMRISWTLCEKHTQSAPTVTYGFIDRPEMIEAPNRFNLASSEGQTGQMSVARGFGIAAASGLSITLDPGTATNGLTGETMQAQKTLSLPASKDSYISVDVVNGGISIQSVANTAARPNMSPHRALLGCAVTDGSSVTAVRDLRTRAPIGPLQLDTETMTPGPRGVWNGDFLRWPYGSAQPPAKWELLTGTWDTDAARSETTKFGAYSLSIPTTAVATDIRSEFHSVEENQVYRLSYYQRGHSTSYNLRSYVYWYDKNKTAVSTTTVKDAAVGTADTYELVDEYAKAPSTAVYARVGFSRATGVNALFDDIKFSLSSPAFHVNKNGSNQTVTATLDTVTFSESHANTFDYGANFGSNKFEAPVSGIYQVAYSIALYGNHGSGSKAVAVYLSKNTTSVSSSTPNGTILGSDVNRDMAAGETIEVSRNFPALPLLAGETLMLTVYESTNSVLVYGDANRTTWGARLVS